MKNGQINGGKNHMLEDVLKKKQHFGSVSIIMSNMNKFITERNKLFIHVIFNLKLKKK